MRIFFMRSIPCMTRNPLCISLLSWSLMMTRLYCSDVVNSVDVLIIETSHGIVICILEYFAKFKTERLFLQLYQWRVSSWSGRHVCFSELQNDYVSFENDNFRIVNKAIETTKNNTWPSTCSVEFKRRIVNVWQYSQLLCLLLALLLKIVLLFDMKIRVKCCTKCAYILCFHGPDFMYMNWNVEIKWQLHWKWSWVDFPRAVNPFFPVERG